jgi:predicted TIM-barrel fold metal-dependent hydrolase
VVVFPFSSGIGKQRILAELIKPYSDRFIPLVFISPHDVDAKQQLLFCLDELGMRGMKLHPWFGNFHVDDITLLAPLFEIIENRKLHVVIHCTTDDHRMHPFRIETLAKAFPAATIPMAHMDTAIASFNAVRMAMLEAPDKLCMGCDFPFYKFEMELLKQDLASKDVGSQDVLKKVMSENIRRVLNIN